MNVSSLGIEVVLGMTGWLVVKVASGGRASRGQPALMVGDVIEVVNAQRPVGSVPSMQLPQTPAALNALCSTGPVSMDVLRSVTRVNGTSTRRMWVHIP
jgi:hypothetical protein